MQASLNIALRGFLKYASGGKVKTAEDFVAQSKDLDYSSIALD